MLRIPSVFASLLAVTCLNVSLGRASPSGPDTEPSSGSTATVTPAPAPARRTRRLIYACREGHTPVFSDRPCGETSILRSLDVVTPAQTGRPPTVEPAPVKAATRPAPQQHEHEHERSLQETAEKCERLKKAVEQIDDRMRAGYPAREAGRLWQRWRDAKDAVRAADC
jgi:hypothetical protein